MEDPAAGLFLLKAEVPVVVTGEEDHQAWLARYPVAPGGSWRVVVALAWCTINSGKYLGQYAIEVRLDGQRVGELTYLMSRRYADIMGQVIDAGGRPGCEAVIRVGERGHEIVVQLPRDPSAVVVPAGAFASPVKRKSRRPMWIAAGAVVFLFVVIGALADEQPSTTDSAATLSTTATDATTTVPTTTLPTTTTTTTTTVPTTTTTAPPTTTTTTTTTLAEPAPKPQPQPNPEPKPKPQPQPQPQPETLAPPPPAPNQGCHPSYEPCVPIASDVDCKPGKGNGPAYVTGPIKVIGPDEYQLDADHDGVGCE